MRKSRVAVTLALAGLLVTASATQVVAREPVGTAKGWITWTGQTDLRPGRTSVFGVRDGTPGEAAKSGDRGWYRFSEKNDTYNQRMTMRVDCVRVEPTWAEFAGVITRATGNFQVGNVFLVSVLDTDTPEPNGFHIGMKGFGDDLDAACDAALDANERNRRGTYTGGYVSVGIVE